MNLNSTATGGPHEVQEAPEYRMDRKPMSLFCRLAFISMLMPLEFSLGSIQMSPSRLLFTVTIPFVLAGLLVGRYGKITFVDKAFLFYVVWSVLCIAINNASVAIQFAGSHVIIVVGGYVAARSGIRTPGQYLSFARWMVTAALIGLCFTVIETSTSLLLINDMLGAIPGVEVYGRASDEIRAGFLRCQWVFRHPIHYGLFCAMTIALPLATFRKSWSQPRRLVSALGISFACFLSVSSGAFMMLLIQWALYFYDWITGGTAKSWGYLMKASAAFYVVVEVLSNRPAAIAILSRLAFNPSTVFIREKLYEFGIEEIKRRPIFGLGYNEWKMPSYMSGSVDNHWLLTAVAFGLPAFIALFSAFVKMGLMIGKNKNLSPPVLSNIRLSYMVTLIGLFFAMGTVALWGPAYSLVLFVFASGSWMTTYKPPQNRATEPTDGQAANRLN